MIAGPNGSGKTTLTKWLQAAGIDFGEHINPDDIAQTLSGSYEERVREAQRVADVRRVACVERGLSFSFETVMSHPSKIEIVERAKAAGFFTQLFFVGIDDPQTNIDRVALRVSRGGHDVPKERIVARWHRTMDQLARAVATVDRAYIFDNSRTGEDIQSPRMILQVDRSPAGPVVRAQLPPIPPWIRRYLIDRLRLSPVRS